MAKRRASSILPKAHYYAEPNSCPPGAVAISEYTKRDFTDAIISSTAKFFIIDNFAGKIEACIIISSPKQIEGTYNLDRIGYIILGSKYSLSSKSIIKTFARIEYDEYVQICKLREQYFEQVYTDAIKRRNQRSNHSTKIIPTHISSVVQGGDASHK